MKIISILFSILLLAGMAWGGDYADTTHCSNSWGDCEPPVITSVTPCMTVCIDWAELDKTTCECKVKKGHCPHCGAKGIKFMETNFIGDECKEQQLPTKKQENGWTNCRTDCGEEVCATMVCDQKYIDVCCLTVYRCPYGHIFWNKE